MTNIPEDVMFHTLMAGENSISFAHQPCVGYLDIDN